MPVEPKLAATVILLRKRKADVNTDNCEFEVFMAKRHENNKFLGGHHVFPGGSIDKQDASKESTGRLIGLDKDFVKNLREIHENPSVIWIIAIRELFEETGILLATNESGDIVAINEENQKKFQDYQEDLQKNQKTMTNILISENLYYYAAKIRYFGRLVTPAMSPIRFDTQFLLCEIPQNQIINLFKDELTEGLWGTPKHFLKLNKKNQIKIIFPQYSTLRRLNKFHTIQEVFDNSKMTFKKNQFIRLGNKS